MPWQHRPVLAYRHAFHAGNHADVLKHLVLVQVLQHLNTKDKGWRLVDTHAGAGGYSLQGGFAAQRREFERGIARLVGRPEGAAALPAPVRDYVGVVRRFNGGDRLAAYPGSPAIALLHRRAQDQLRLYELHPTEHRILAEHFAHEPGVEVHAGDGYAAIKAMLPPPTRRGLVLIDPPYEIKTDYAKTLGALREALTRFPEGLVMVWLPQLALVEAAQLPQRLKAAADTLARRGWLHARLTVAQVDARGFGLAGSSVFVANPPHTLHDALAPVLPWLARELAQFDSAKGLLERSAGG
jgi:23S rRNA (adenine2030-N6)-methyltransferase